MFISALRCTLTYLVFPFVMPVVGITSGIGPSAAMLIGVVAIVANLVSIHRFWSTDHKYKVQTTTVNMAMIVALVVLLAGDVSDLVSEQLW